MSFLFSCVRSRDFCGTEGSVPCRWLQGMLALSLAVGLASVTMKHVDEW